MHSIKLTIVLVVVISLFIFCDELIIGTQLQILSIEVAKYLQASLTIHKHIRGLASQGRERLTG
jgi:hypothetical protein